jgi:hypothetical protein
MNTVFPIRIFAKTRYLLLMVEIFMLVVSGTVLIVSFGSPGFVFTLPPFLISLILGIARVSSTLGLIIFGSFLFFILKLCLRPVLEIDEEGIVAGGSGISAGRISWADISDIRLISYSGRSYVGIVPVDVGGVLKHSGFFARILKKRVIAMGLPPILIPAEILGLDPSQLITDIKNYRQSLK